MDPDALTAAVAAAREAFARRARPRRAGRRQARPPRRPRPGAARPPRARVAAAARPRRRGQAGERRAPPRPRRRSTRGTPRWWRSATQRVLVEEAVDVTLPWDRQPARRPAPAHPLAERIADVFVGMGWEVAEGPEVESEWFNFDALNFEPDHPARSHAGHVLPGRRPDGASSSSCAPTPRRCRSARCWSASCPSTSSCPGRTFRTDELDATHTPVFHQVEGLAVDKRHHDGAPARARSTHFARAMFGAESRTRLRPSYFPFTEPSAEVDVWFPEQEGRRAAGSSGAAAAWSTRTCCAPAASTRRSTPASRSAWASSARCSSATASPTCATWSRATCGSAAAFGI